MAAVDGVHDLGGMEDFGPVIVEPTEPVFHAGWEGRVFAIGGILSVQGLTSTNDVRHAIERMDPAHYLGSPYFEHWLTAFATLLVERGVLTRAQLEARSGGPFPLSRRSRATRPLSEDTNTTRPRDSRRRGSTACVTATCATTLTSSCRRSCAADSASTGPPSTMPALLTRASSRAGTQRQEMRPAARR